MFREKSSEGKRRRDWLDVALTVGWILGIVLALLGVATFIWEEQFYAWLETK